MNQGKLVFAQLTYPGSIDRSHQSNHLLSNFRRALRCLPSCFLKELYARETGLMLEQFCSK